MNIHFTLHAGTAEAVIDLQGGYVHSWTIDGIDILYVGKDPKRRGIPLLFPYFGKPDSALPQHGFARDTRWRLDTSSANFASLVFSNSDISDAARIYYPYPFEVHVDMELAATRLTYTLRITNTGLKDMPISPGLHPYWAVPHAQKHRIQIKGIEGFDASSIDWDTQPPDEDFPYLEKVIVKMPQYSVSIEEVTPNHLSTEQITVWSQPLTSADHDFVCVEPICGLRGGYVVEPILVAPTETWSAAWEFHVTLA
ncbi:MAG: hypothetical protein WCJ70_02160 [bacterium]